ncbi:MAG: cyclase family protein [Deltaproteobacteria bacterium]|nr:cyclase family protein [Deltaproteobacteria bacterium]
MNVIDISPVIDAETAVFPGDRPFSREVALAFEHGGNLELSAVTTTVHIGAHVDAPSHYVSGGAPIDARSLHYYMGPCQVVRVRLPRGRRIQRSDFGRVTAPRVLIRTDSFPDPSCWNGDFNALSAELVDALSSEGVILIGIDTPSVDLADDKVLESHKAIFRHDMAVLEGIVLDAVDEGTYTLVALPLKIRDADASPVRAVLVKGAL